MMADIMKARIPLPRFRPAGVMHRPARATSPASLRMTEGSQQTKTADPSHKVEIEETASHRIIRSNGWPDHTPWAVSEPGEPEPPRRAEV